MNFESLHYFLEIKSIRKQFKPAAQCWAESGPWLQCKARRPTSWLGHGLVARSSCGGGPARHASDALAVWSPRGGHARDGGAARLAHMLHWTRCPGNSGVSTMRAAATRLTRRWRRGLTRAAARSAGAERRQCGDVPRWRRRSGHGWRQWQGPASQEGKGEGEAHATCEPRRTEDWLTEEVETRRRGGLVFWWRGGEVTKERRGLAR
jgi:hypothetical protein